MVTYNYPITFKIQAKISSGHEAERREVLSRSSPVTFRGGYWNFETPSSLNFQSLWDFGAEIFFRQNQLPKLFEMQKPCNFQHFKAKNLQGRPLEDFLFKKLFDL